MPSSSSAPLALELALDFALPVFLCAAATASASVRSLPLAPAPLAPLAPLAAAALAGLAASSWAFALPLAALGSAGLVESEVLTEPPHLPRGSRPAALRQVEQSHFLRQRGTLPRVLCLGGRAVFCGIDHHTIGFDDGLWVLVVEAAEGGEAVSDLAALARSAHKGALEECTLAGLVVLVAELLHAAVLVDVVGSDFLDFALALAAGLCFDDDDDDDDDFLSRAEDEADFLSAGFLDEAGVTLTISSSSESSESDSASMVRSMYADDCGAAGEDVMSRLNLGARLVRTKLESGGLEVGHDKRGSGRFRSLLVGHTSLPTLSRWQRLRHCAL
ncbi:hypothetical protein L1887_62142 [Cichorium endivia]|nr:hypothetical protein L1887_62142 [Cichorium endivia]